MATFDDFHGVYFTVQALRMYQPLDLLQQSELIVVDSNPSGEHGKSVKDLLGWVKGDFESVRYVPLAENVGTAHPREMVFKEAHGAYVVCMDCHVLFPYGVLGKLVEYYDAHPETQDLLSGPMLYDDFVNFATHFDDQWRAEMWGTWGSDLRATDPNSPPFEIPACGLGVFSCRKDAWLHFNPRFKGFGGEEFYIHEKFRQAGHKCLCLPFFRWLHRFGRPDGVKYPLTRWDKIRNYVIGHAELGIPLDRIREHFLDTSLIPKDEWDVLIADPLNPPDWPPSPAIAAPGCGGCKGTKPDSRTLSDLYDEAASTPSDINEHAAKLKELASQAQHVTEFGMRHSVSTVALLAGQPQTFVTYAAIQDPMGETLKFRQGVTAFDFRKGTSLAAEIDETDLLFLDTKHTGDHLYAELTLHAPKVRQRIAVHDTQIYGEMGEDGTPGLLAGLRRFVKEHPEWSVIYHATNNHGFTVLSRDPADKPALPGKITMAVNFAKAMAAYASDGLKKADPDVFEKRLEVCSLCPLRSDDRCTVCGCFLEEKAGIRVSECPVGKWPVSSESV